MAVREFNGSTDRLILATGGLLGATHGTYGVICKVDDTAVVRTQMAFMGSGGVTFRWAPFQVNGADRQTWNSSSQLSGVLPMATWLTIIVRKATGTTTPRFSYFNHTALTWTHADGGTAVANSTALIGSDVICLDSGSSSETMDGRVAVLAGWSNQVRWSADASGDTAIENAGLHLSLENWVITTPSFLCPLNQDAVTTGVTDIVGVSNQTSITGTTVVTGDDPPGFDFTLTGWPAFSRPILAGKIGPDRNVQLPGRWPPQLDSGSVAVDVLAPAGLAAATGDALAASVTIQPKPGVADGTGIANQAIAQDGVLAGVASGTGTANQATASIGVLAGSATGLGEAFGVTALTSEAAPAKPIVATAAALSVAQSAYRKPIPTPIVFGAPEAEPATEAPAGLAAATGTAFQAAVDSGRPTQPLVISTTNQTAWLRYHQPTAQFVDLGAGFPVTNVYPTVAEATGVANQPEAEIGAKPNTATGTGEALQPTVSTSAGTNAPAGLAAATGTANAASVTIQPNAGVGLAAGLANPPTGSLGVKPGAPTGTGSAPQATVSFGALAGLATAAGAANTPKIDIHVNAGIGGATGQAFPGFILTGNPTGPGQPLTAQDGTRLTARDGTTLTAQDGARPTARDGVGLVAVDGDHSLEVLR